jgi:hypothetical protein
LRVRQVIEDFHALTFHGIDEVNPKPSITNLA